MQIAMRLNLEPRLCRSLRDEHAGQAPPLNARVRYVQRGTAGFGWLRLAHVG